MLHQRDRLSKVTTSARSVEKNSASKPVCNAISITRIAKSIPQAIGSADGVTCPSPASRKLDFITKMFMEGNYNLKDDDHHTDDYNNNQNKERSTSALYVPMPLLPRFSASHRIRKCIIWREAETRIRIRLASVAIGASGATCPLPPPAKPDVITRTLTSKKTRPNALGILRTTTQSRL